jgi:hypothetical protein
VLLGVALLVGWLDVALPADGDVDPQPANSATEASTAPATTTLLRVLVMSASPWAA